MNNPLSTYRIQFHKEFTFSDFELIIPYLQKLGVGTIYASPIFESVPGSTHGYDGTNPLKINPEIGTHEQLRTITSKLKADGIQWLQDIVPNHMAFHPQNPWLMDVLEKGRRSEYASFFDIDWDNEAFNGKILVPFLGAGLDEVLANELQIEYKEDRFVLTYYDSAYPLSPRSYSTILASHVTHLQDVRQLIRQLEVIDSNQDTKAFASQWHEFLLQLSSLKKNADVKEHIETCLKFVNSDKGKLKQIVEQQAYQLEHWKKTDKQINFRRFFTVNGLICLNIQDKQVFEHFHSYIKDLVGQQIFQGLRIDHIDGLSDPSSYLKQLRELAGDDTYIIVEKILEQGEQMEERWTVQGNTGYDFLGMLNNLFTNKDAEKKFSKFYKKLTGDKRSIHQQLHDKKAYILNQHMAGELENLYRLFLELELISKTEIEVVGDLKAAIAEFLVQCPVYRFYGNEFPLKDAEANAIQDILNRIRSSNAELYVAVGLLEQVFLIKPLKADEDYNSRALKFYQRCMQFTGPLMAKGVEDTLMYTYNRFIGHNEVGDSPEAFGYTEEEFHKMMIERQAVWPLSLNGTSTHDTKRGEDVRTRLNVLTDLDEEWIEAVEKWTFLNQDLSNQYRLDPNDEYFIYQTLLGSMPMPGQDDSDYEERIHEYLVKALREGKLNSNWAHPDEDYENRAKEFVSALLDKDKPFFRILKKFIRKTADFGIVNSLSQVILKFACPGVPDIYQGTEFWDLSLVDPDNRRPVDYSERFGQLQNLAETEKDESFLTKLWEDRNSGSIKLWLTHKLLNLRKEDKDLFSEGDYIPLHVKGKYKKHIFSFARRLKSEWIVVAVPLHSAKLAIAQNRSVRELNWKNTRIILPADAPIEFEHVLDNKKSKVEGEILIKQVFENLPLAVLRMKRKVGDRGAGILLHITSLPSPFGIGDFGPGAREFADYLSSAGQKYWQILPLSPTEEGQGYSPYSSISSMAGNTVLISPELLADEGLLDSAVLKQYHTKGRDEVDYSTAKKVKDKFFDEAYHNFCNSGSSLNGEFLNFCEQEAEWLSDFALYVVLKQQFDGRPWYEWSTEYKLRDPDALGRFAEENSDSLNKVKWLQYIFFKQWADLRSYCNKRDIQLFGDLPFYVSNDSSDVWANKEIFCLDENGIMTGVAGVPPDYFNDNGQLWGMPVFKWDVLKEQKYSWWVKRIKKNMELYDLLRLDHFRAFSSYWDVPAAEETAINGEWKPGPSSDFFRVLKEELGELPFVAEDLGDVDQAVYDLRDEFGLPGMRVVQFTFGDDLAQSVHSPHNFTANSVVYTGTHDNNTSKGWFRQDTDVVIKRNLERYSNSPAKEKNIHRTLGKLAYSSIAKVVIMPMQDVLGLDEQARMNTPASIEKNWLWRLKPGQLKKKYAERLREWARMYNRE